jgi:hypothetical protein
MGRAPFLQDLRDRVARAREQSRWPKQVIRGLGGIGKTRLAVEYARRHSDAYTALLFLNGESAETLNRDLAALAGVLQLNLPEGTPDPERIAGELAWLQAYPGWLLIVDNVDDRKARDAVAGLLTHWSGGHVLITGRWRQWTAEVEALDLHVLLPEDAAHFLLARTAGGRQPAPADLAESEHLAKDLGYLCLALEQAAACITDVPTTLAEYRRRWRGNVKCVRTWADRIVMRYHEEKDVSLSVATTWQTTFDQLTPSARKLLQVLSWLSSEPGK